MGIAVAIIAVTVLIGVGWVFRRRTSLRRRFPTNWAGQILYGAVIALLVLVALSCVTLVLVALMSERPKMR
jgi:hypothetical protein